MPNLNQLARMKWILCIFFLMMWLIEPLVGQKPFVCKGDFYFISRPLSGQSSDLFSIRIDQFTDQATFENLNIERGFDLNAMGYRSTDNLIYTIDQVNLALMRIDADGVVTRLRILQELPKHRYFGGTCTPDGNHLAIAGSTQNFGSGSYT